MAANVFDWSVLSLLWQSRLKETHTITQNREKIAQRRLRRYLRRRRLVSSLFFLFVTRYIFAHLPARHVWTKPRSKLFWEETCHGCNERDWVENFRMSKEAFNRLCVELSPHILKRDTNFRKAITVRHRVAITLYWLTDTNTGRFANESVRQRPLHQLMKSRATLKPGNRKLESGIGNQNPESGIRNPESGIHKSKKTSSSNSRKLFFIAFAGKK